MCWLKKINRKFDKLPTKMLKAMREESIFKIRLCRTRKTWPNYGIYKMYWNGDHYYPDELLERITLKQLKNGEAKRLLNNHQRDYIMNTLIRGNRIQYEQYGIKI